MTLKSLPGKKAMLAVVMASALILLTIYYRKALWVFSLYLVDVLTDREKITAFVSSFGAGAPLIFILFQVLQVLFAPVPGEASGFIGGYLFGALQGFFYSSIGLALGSIVNFGVGRFLGERYIRKLLPSHVLARFESLLKRQGIIVLLVLFIFPGFPKDYLCLLLGLTSLPFKLFVLLATFGRMPGTLMLSLQGAYVYKEMYDVFAVLFGISLILVILMIRYREALYRWIEHFNRK
ncbi:MAG: TVP38/TMEM64 family protein [Proteobacteria bacterium]|nr:TVP38/TMEM64 family protein [Pseudomonadota bacterium]